MELAPCFPPKLPECALAGPEHHAVFRPDERCRGGQQHDVRSLDESLRQPPMPVPKAAQHEGLEEQMSALFVEEALTDASQQRRTRSIPQRGIIRSSQDFGGHENFEAQFEACQPAQPPENRVNPMSPQTRGVFQLEESR